MPEQQQSNEMKTRHGKGRKSGGEKRQHLKPSRNEDK